MGLASLFSFLTGNKKKPKEVAGTNILQLNYDIYTKIFSYLTSLEDQLSLIRAHPYFLEAVTSVIKKRCQKINMRMLKNVDDWEFLLKLCGSQVVRCEVPHGYWDLGVAHPFLALLGRHCPNLSQVLVIFMRTDFMKPRSPENDPDIKAMNLLLELPALTDLTLIDAKASQLEHLQYFDRLITLDVDGVDPYITVEGFEKIFENKDDLQSLHINFGRAFRRTYQLARVRDGCPGLTHLTLENFDVSYRCVEGEFRNLQSLHLIAHSVMVVSNEFFYTLVKRHSDSLKHLQLQYVEVLPDQVNFFASFKSLTTLASDNLPIDYLEPLSEMSNLKCLAMDSMMPFPKDSRQLANILQNCTKLEHLKLGERWKIESGDLVRLVHDDAAFRPDRTRKLQLTLLFIKDPDRQQELTNIVRDKNVLELSFRATYCDSCPSSIYALTKMQTLFS